MLQDEQVGEEKEVIFIVHFMLKMLQFEWSRINICTDVNEYLCAAYTR